MAIQIQFRRGLAATWTSVNPILAIGEAGYETDTGKFKVGNGSSNWNSLPYSSGPAGPTGPTGAASTVTGPTGPTGSTGPYSLVAQTSAPSDTNVLWLDTDDPGVAALAVDVKSDYNAPYSYIGVAVAGSPTGSAVWRVTRINVGPPVVSTVASSIEWDDRYTATYS